MGQDLIKLTDAGLQLVSIKEQEADSLSELSREIYAQYYLYLWYDSGEWYQQTRYNPSTLAGELSSPQSNFYWIRQGGQKAGYIKINQHVRPPELAGSLGTHGLEIERIYLYKEFANHGLGQKVMEWVEALARQHSQDYLFLYTMDSSRALFFYEKIGYQKAAEKRLPFEKMKPEYRGMYLMIKELR